MKQPKTPEPVRPSKLVRCAFTYCEAGHIMSLIEANERNGEHTAPSAQYWNRSNRIINKFRDAFEKAKAPNEKGQA